MRARTSTILTIALALGFLYGLWNLYELRFAAGDIYPPYSSLRADPLGTKALFESIQQLPGMSAERSYRPIANLPKTPATVLFLGENPSGLQYATEERLKEYEALASRGARIVIAMRPVRRVVDPSPSDAKQLPLKPQPPEQSVLQKRWGITIDYIRQAAKQAVEDNGNEPKVTALYFRFEGKVLYEVERKFGSGSVTLVANSYPYSNEALAGDRNVRLLARILGGNPLVIFDESHLGLTESGSVGALVRKYHLEGLVAILAVLLALFIWKNSTSLLPTRNPTGDSEAGVETKDAGAGLANLLRRNISPKTLMQTCWNEWERSRFGGRHYSPARIARARAIKLDGPVAAETYREVARILAEKT